MLFKNVADNFVLNDTKQRIVEIAYDINTRMKSNDGRISDIYRY